MLLHPTSLLPIAAPPALVDLLHLPRAGPLSPREMPHDRLAGRSLGPGQGHQILHRAVTAQLAPPHQLMRRRRQPPHQRQPPRHPALRPLQLPRQLRLRQPMDLDELPEQPPVLQCRPRMRALLTMPKQQRRRLTKGQHLPLHRISPHNLERLCTTIAIDQHVSRRSLAVPSIRHHQHWVQLPLCRQRRHQSCFVSRKRYP